MPSLPEFNSIKRRMFGFYTLDDAKEKISMEWRYPSTAKEKFTGSFKQIENKMELNGRIGQNSLQVQLLKLSE